MAGYLQALIEAMPWSWSRLNSFDTCKYGWYLKYILGLTPGEQKFFSGFGSLMHRVLERWIGGGATKDELITYYLQNFREATAGETPKPEMRMRYFDDGLDYIRSIDQLEIDPIAVERKVSFNKDGSRFVGVIDCLAKDKDGIVVLDHKSRRMKQRSKRKTPTESDLELDHALMQLYVYAAWVKEKYGEFPAWLIFNCFRDRRMIKTRFDVRKYEQTMNWVKQKIREISETEDFPPDIDYFKCRYLCDMSDHCEYYQANFGKE